MSTASSLWTMAHSCDWVNDDPLMIDYHDKEWGVPTYDDQELFEFLILEGAQAGLSWSTVLKKRARYQAVFDGFDPKKVSKYTEKKVEQLLQDSGIIRNRLKVQSAIRNAKIFLDIQKEFGSFSDYLWSFVKHKPIHNSYHSWKEVPATSKESDALSKDLKKRGMNFVGSTIMYAYMQAVGMVNDHELKCPRHKEIKNS